MASGASSGSLSAASRSFQLRQKVAKLFSKSPDPSGIMMQVVALLSQPSLGPVARVGRRRRRRTGQVFVLSVLSKFMGRCTRSCNKKPKFVGHRSKTAKARARWPKGAACFGLTKGSEEDPEPAASGRSMDPIETKWLGDPFSGLDFLGEGLCKGEQAQKRPTCMAPSSRR